MSKPKRCVGYGRKLEGRGWLTDAAVYHAIAARQIYPTFSFNERETNPAVVAGALAFAATCVLLGVFIGFALWGGR